MVNQARVQALLLVGLSFQRSIHVVMSCSLTLMKGSPMPMVRARAVVVQAPGLQESNAVARCPLNFCSLDGAKPKDW